MIETLFLYRALAGGFYLKDAKGFSLGFFKTEEAARQWCKDFGYKMRLN